MGKSGDMVLTSHCYGSDDDKQDILELKCDESNLAKSMDIIVKHTHDKAESAYNWYIKRARYSRTNSKTSHYCLIIATSLAGVLPICDQIEYFECLDLNPLFSTLMLAVAGILIAFDKFSGWSSSWLRFVESHVQINSLIQQFQFDIQSCKLSSTNGQPERKDALAIVGVCRKLNSDISEISKEDFKKWADEFRKSLKELASRLEKGQDELSKPTHGAIDVQIKGADKSEEGWKLYLNSELQRELSHGSTAALPHIAPGTHVISVQAKIEGKLAVSEKNAEVKAGEIVKVELEI